LPFLFSRGDVYQASFPFEEDETQAKDRTVLIWMPHTEEQLVLVSKITGTMGRSRWEVPLLPAKDQTNGIVKPCVIRVDQTRYIPIRALLSPRGSLNAFEIASAEKLLREFLNTKR